MTEYADRLAQEKSRFDAEINVHDLPDIFHYWSNKYLRPFINSFGYDGSCAWISATRRFYVDWSARGKPDLKTISN